MVQMRNLQKSTLRLKVCDDLLTYLLSSKLIRYLFYRPFVLFVDGYCFVLIASSFSASTVMNYIYL